MYRWVRFCIICLRNQSVLQQLSTAAEDGTSYCVKLITCVPQMHIVVEKMDNGGLLLCDTCTRAVDSAYDLHNSCLRNKSVLLDYMSQLRTVDNLRACPSLKIADYCDVTHDVISTIRVKQEGSYYNEFDNIISGDAKTVSSISKIKESNIFNRSVQNYTKVEKESSSFYPAMIHEEVNIKTEVELEGFYHEENVDQLDVVTKSGSYTNNEAECSSSGSASLHGEIELKIEGECEEYEDEVEDYIEIYNQI